MIQKSVTPLYILVFFMTACSATDQASNEKIGATTGAVIGAVLGSRIGGSMDDRTGRILGASLGALFGSVIGKEVARTLSEAELRQADEAAQEAMESTATDQSVKWSNPESGNSGTATPTTDSRQIDGEDCRQFESSVLIDGERRVAAGRACRQADGSWKIMP